jgi:prepilin-type N-terminal cleavage/methylation domain-containing protein
MLLRWQAGVQGTGRKQVKRQGLTLMEMVVVLSILAALAAIMIPLFPNILRRAHKATDATQTSEVAKAVQLYQALYFSYPNDLDALVTATGSEPDFLPGAGSGAGVFGGFTTTYALQDQDVAALGRVGLTSLQALISTNPAHPTMNPYPSPDMAADRITLAAGKTVRILNNAAIWSGANPLNPSFLQAANAADPGATYMVVGVGPRNSMVSKVMQDAPQSVPQDNSFTPSTRYSRVGLIFKIRGAEVTQTERARFIAAVALEDDELEQTDKDISGYYDVVKAN